MHCRNYIVTGFITAAVIASCNLAPKKDATDSTKAPIKPDTTQHSVQRDTTFGDLHITAIARGDASMRNLLIAIGNKKDSTRADTIIERDIKGQLEAVMVGDLDRNGKPELYCYMLSEGTGRYGNIYAYDFSGDKILRISTNAVDTLELPAYRGHDSFYIKNENLVRTFPVYREGAPDALTADTRMIVRYGLQKNDGGFELVQIK
ncbi:hypothetical protein CLV51_104214 [Chitinophaga niastensis]|uniref:PliI/PliC-like inhibitor of I-type lysozyme n=1 Tax=Chitinophaga niastensis TaxID=536980 RepID=A0A2P8HH20_CHINA|nr:hypothetical protein [Chitinophaga niastensis]PSL45509.1 hypothetical protein CLV51_104214 [Chitinophaga niastensis]